MDHAAKAQIRKIWTVKYGLVLRPQAAQWLAQLIQHFQLAPEDIAEHMESMAKAYHESDLGTIVTAEGLEAIYQKLQTTEDATAAHHLDEEAIDIAQHIKIIDSYAMPPLKFNMDTKAFERNSDSVSVAPPANMKAQYLRDRFNIIKQTILRNEHFSPPALPGHDRENYMKLTSIKNLLGRQGNRFLIFGLLGRSQDGSFCLEDLDDTVKLDLSEATPAQGLFTEGAFVLVDGEYTADAIFKVIEIGHPPSEQRESARSIFGHVDFLGTGAITATDQEKLIENEKNHPNQFVIISDFHLDQPKTLSHFRAILDVYEETDERPAIFVLCGNFASKPFLHDGHSTKAYQGYFTAFADLVSNYPECSNNCHFVFVPGPTDPSDSLVLPQRPLPTFITKPVLTKLPRATFASNPCRIQFLAQEVVIFREDLMSKMLRNDLGMDKKDDVDNVSERMQRNLVQTILDQGHLSPLSLNVRPVYWAHDHALRLFPLPTTLVLADKYVPYSLTYEGCHVFNPGSFAGTDYKWSTYHTQTRESEASCV